MKMWLPSRGSVRGALALSALILFASPVVPVFVSPAEAVFASPPTCYPNRRRCIRCIEAEVSRDGRQRCTKCGRIPGCRPGLYPPYR